MVNIPNNKKYRAWYIFFKIKSIKVLIFSILHTQRELFNYIVLELRTFALENRVSTFWYQCSQCYNEMVRREKLN